MRRGLLVELALLAAIAVAVALVMRWRTGGEVRAGAAPEPPSEAVFFPQETTDRVLMSRFADERLIVRTAMKEVPQPVTDPLDPKTVYRYLSAGYARRKGAAPGSQAALRFEVYAEDEAGLSYADRACRLLLRYWDMLSRRLDGDHPLAYRRVVTVFLKNGGKPGAEQRIVGGPDATGQLVKRNAIYVYDVAGLTNPLEFCREMAHEYGHAALPAVGGFREPEEWVNGDVGEDLFLTWLLVEMRAGTVERAELFDLDEATLSAWLGKQVEPAVTRVLRTGFDPSVLDAGDTRALDALIGFLLAVDATHGDAALARGLKLSGGSLARDVYRGVGRAISERESVELRAPEGGKPFWAYLPGEAWAIEGASISGSAPDWLLLKPTGGAISAHHKPE